MITKDKLSRFEQLHNSLKSETNVGKLKEIQDRLWQIDMVDRWQRQDFQDYEIFVELERIYRDIVERENREYGRR